MRSSKKYVFVLSLTILFAAGFDLSSMTSESYGADEISAEEFLQSPAATLYQTGNYQQSLEALDDLLKDHPSDTLLLRYRAMTLDKLGRYEEAVDGFNRILNQSPDNVPTRFFLGHTYERMGKQELAINEWRSVAKEAAGTIYAEWANENLERVSAVYAAPRPVGHKWEIAGRYGYEYDTNVTLKPDDEALASPGENEAGRHIMDLILKNHTFTTRDTTVDLQFAARQSLHDNGLDDFNFTSLEFGVDARKRVNIFEHAVVAGARYDLLSGFLDGSTFSLKNRGTFSLDTRFTANTRSVLSYRLTGAEYGPDGSNPPRTSRDGIYHDIGATQYWYFENFKRYIFARGEYNHADTRGGNFDLRGFTTRVGYHTPLLWKTDFDVSGEYQFADYPNFVSLSSLDTDKRRNHELDFYVSLTHYLTPEIGIRVFYRSINVDNRNGFFEYDRDIAGAQVLYAKSF